MIYWVCRIVVLFSVICTCTHNSEILELSSGHRDVLVLLHESETGLFHSYLSILKALRDHLAVSYSPLHDMAIGTLNVSSDLSTWGNRGIAVVPALVLFKEGNDLLRPYMGRRSVHFVHSWLLRTLGLRLRYVSSMIELEALWEKIPVLAFGYFPSVDTDVLNTFRDLARLVPDVLFVYSSEPLVGAGLTLDTDSVAILHRGGIDSWELWNAITLGLAEIDLMIKFVVLNTFPLVLDLTNPAGGSGGFGGSVLDVFEFSNDRPVLILVGKLNLSESTKWSIRKREILLIHIACGSLGMFTRWLGSTNCGNAWIYFQGKKYLAANHEFDDSSILAFLDDYSQDSLSEYRRGEQTNDSFPQLVLLFTPWCAACLNAMDDFDALGDLVTATFKGVIRVSKLDVSETDTDIFPDLLLYFSESDFVRYGSRIDQPDRILAWITTHAVSRAPAPHHDEL